MNTLLTLSVLRIALSCIFLEYDFGKMEGCSGKEKFSVSMDIDLSFRKYRIHLIISSMDMLEKYCLS